jgi:putative thiamine transport system permease protein
MGKALRQVVLPVCVGSIVLVPIVLTLLYAVSAGSDMDGWRQLLTDPRLPRALVLTVGTGIVATAVAIAATGYMLGLVFHSNRWQAATASLGPILAVPHAALAVALILWVAPSGILLRAVSPWPSGFDLPPDVALANDPFGLGLTICLVLKETPFLLWSAMSQLQRADVGARLRAELSVCYSLGYSRIQAWWKIAWPQVWPRLAAPIFAVLAYNLTVVDVAQVIGPQSPPTLALLTWQWLADSQTDVNAQGAAALPLWPPFLLVLADGFASHGRRRRACDVQAPLPKC